MPAESKQSASHFGEGSMPLFASKSLSFKEIYRMMAEEEIGTDIVSSGELFTAVSAGFPMERAFFHGNNKTDFDIKYAIENGIGYFVADNEEEVKAVEAEAARKGIRQKLLLRLTPTQDIAAAVGCMKTSTQKLCGFALETHNALVHAQEKLQRKNLDMIVMNSLQDAGAGFQVDTNKVTIITPDNQESLPLQSKNDIAREIINRFLS